MAVTVKACGCRIGKLKKEQFHFIDYCPKHKSDRLLDAVEKFLNKLGDKSDITKELKDMQAALLEARGH